MEEGHHARWKNLSGFTIVEIVMTLVIVGVLSVVAAPRFFSTITYQRQVYYDEVLNSIRYARTLAVASGTHIQVSLTSTSIMLQRRTEGGTCTTGTVFTNITDPAMRSTSYVKTAPGTITLSSSANWPIYFDGLGRAFRASNCTLLSPNATVTVSGGNTITILGETGFTQ
jgi:MSHA pilin protein MshC